MSTPKPVKKEKNEVSQLPVPSKVDVPPEAAKVAIGFADQIDKLKPGKKVKGVV